MAKSIKFRSSAVATSAPLLSGRGACRHFGYACETESKRDIELQTPVELPPNSPSIGQRTNPANGPGVTDHRGFDILAPMRTPVFAATDKSSRRASLSLRYGPC